MFWSRSNLIVYSFRSTKTSHNFGAQTEEKMKQVQHFQLPSLYFIFTDQHSLHDTIGTMIINNRGHEVRETVARPLAWRTYAPWIISSV